MTFRYLKKRKRCVSLGFLCRGGSNCLFRPIAKTCGVREKNKQRHLGKKEKVRQIEERFKFQWHLL